MPRKNVNVAIKQEKNNVLTLVFPSDSNMGEANHAKV